MSEKPIEYQEIPEEWFELFRTVLRLDHTAEEPQLQVVFRRKFWTLKKLLDRMGLPFVEQHAVQIAYEVEEGGMPASVSRPTSFIDVCNRGEVKPDDPVEALFANQWRMGLYVSHNVSGEVLVQIDGHERRVNGDEVRWPASRKQTETQNALRRKAG